jgi:hypothetical protein
VQICEDECCNRSTGFVFPPSNIIENKINPFSIFPNPARDKLYVKLNERQVSFYTYKIFNQLGIEMYSGSGQQTVEEVNLSIFPPGLYVIRINADIGYDVFEKIIKY